MASHSSWHGADDDFWSLFCFVAAILIVIVIFFDASTHCLTHWLHHEGHERKHMLMAKYREKMCYLLWVSLQTELMVLGFLALAIWSCKLGGLFQWIVSMFPASHPLKKSDSPVPGTRVMPHEAEELVELVEHTHMVLFISMVLYFLFLALVFKLHLSELCRFEIAEFKEAHHQSLLPSEERDLKHVQARRRYLLGRVAFMFEEELENRPQIKASMDAGTLDYTAFLEATTQELVNDLVQFPLWSWLLIGTYFVILAPCARWLDISLEFFFDIILNGSFALSTLYMSIRLFVFWRHVDKHRNHRTGAWPLPTWDRITSLFVGPGIAGFYPWSQEPDEVSALHCTQALLYFQMVWLVYIIVPNPFTHKLINVGAVQVIVRCLCLAMWGFWILPKQLQMFALPPFITNEEVELLFHIQDMYPYGATYDHSPQTNVDSRVLSAQNKSSLDHFLLSLRMKRRRARLKRSISCSSALERKISERPGLLELP